MTKMQIDNFWEKVDVRANNECWIWRGGRSATDGYGRFRVGKKKYGSHRISFFLKHGRFPNGLAMHSCDTPLCCNPNHISDGNYSQNIKDAYARGRIVPKRGELNGNHILTIDQVVKIKNAVGSQRKIAREFGVCQRTVCAIKNGYVWKKALDNRNA
jgi:hypothetical protein